MILTIAKMILIFVALVFVVIVVSTVIWVLQAIIRWIREERRKRNETE